MGLRGVMNQKCPVCKKSVASSHSSHVEKSEYFPFCSTRCKLVDLGAWFDQEYRIASDKSDQNGQEN